MTNGFLNVRKPQGLTSHQCVQIVRKLFKTRQVGHGGTLDPMATGVMTVALGKATRFLQYLTSDKEYAGVIRFGLTTDSDDITGKILTERSVPWLSETEVRSALQRFVGHVDQVPPRISAIKKDGKRLYKLARTNQVVRMIPRRVHISKIDLLKFTNSDFPEASIQVVCGSGTYIRSIARECGEALTIPSSLADSSCHLRNSSGEFCVGGTLTMLERLRSGVFSIEESLTFDEITHQLEAGKSPVQSIESGMLHLGFAVLTPKAMHRWQIGGEVFISSSDVKIQAQGTEESLTQKMVADKDTIRIYSSPPASKFLGVSQVEKQRNKNLFVLRKRIFV